LIQKTGSLFRIRTERKASQLTSGFVSSIFVTEKNNPYQKHRTDTGTFQYPPGEIFDTLIQSVSKGKGYCTNFTLRITIYPLFIFPDIIRELMGKQNKCEAGKTPPEKSTA